MSIESMALVLHHSRATGSDLVVELGIANHDGDGGAWPSIATLSRYSKVQPRGVKKILRRLESLGEVRVDLQAGGTRELADHERPNRYTLLVECPEGCAGGTKHKPKKGWQRYPDGTYARLDDDTNPTTLPVDNQAQEGVSWRTPGVLADMGGGVPEDTQTVQVTTQPNEGSAPGTDRTREDTARCTVCSYKGKAECERRQQAYPLDERHAYAPARQGRA